ncbi:site-specific integrase [Nitrobacter sp. Nb-311A]|uniref:site-specific integrase n=1 Tax=Nitrobacter sp. Nb-311A TaxID=314253 RepID=UPI0002E77BD3|nr:site-specific integrase [Nitrobacter sp. Nb-311A]
MMPATSNVPASRPNRFQVRSLPIAEWPAADRDAWIAACRPSQRLVRGGAGAHMKPITLSDLARRYGYFLDFLDRSGLLDRRGAAAGHVTPENVAGYLDELQMRVSSVTVYGSIFKLRRASELLDPQGEFTWLTEIEKDLALVMRPRSKADRFVLSEVLVENGLALMAETEHSTTRSDLAKARQFRNGLMVAMLALHPIRLKNFASLEIGRNFVNIEGRWWIILGAGETKEKRPDERCLDDMLVPSLEKYLSTNRDVLAQKRDSNALWLSSADGQPMTYSAVADAIKKTTLTAIGVGVSSHMFRTAAASSAAVHAGHNPNLASALLHHRDRRVTEEHYNRASSLSAAMALKAVLQEYVEDKR